MICSDSQEREREGGRSFDPPSTPQLLADLTQVTQLAVGDTFACALSVTGAVSCWGDNQYGQLGDGTRIRHTSPEVVPGLTGVVQISAEAPRPARSPTRARCCAGQTTWLTSTAATAAAAR